MKSSGLKCNEHNTDVFDGSHLARFCFTKSTHFFPLLFGSGVRFSKLPRTFRGAFRVFFSGPEKCFSEHPKVSRIVSRYFRESFRVTGYDINATRAGGKIILEHGFIITTFNFSS